MPRLEAPKTFGIYGDPGRLDAMREVRQRLQPKTSRQTHRLETKSRTRRSLENQPTFGIFGDPGR